MSLTIVATPGSASANSYVTEAEAIAYAAARLNLGTGGWSTVTGSTCTETEKAALIEAQREFGNLNWVGWRVDTTQVLEWPRAWAPNPDSPMFAWTYFATDVIPLRVKDAACELAIQFLKAGTTDIASLPSTIGIKQKTIDVLTTVYSDYNQPVGLTRYPRILNSLRALLTSTTGNNVPVIRG